MGSRKDNEQSFEISYEETAAGDGEGVLTDHRTGDQHPFGSLTELMDVLSRIISVLPGEEDEDGSSPEPNEATGW